MATLYDGEGNEFEIDDDLLNGGAPPQQQQQDGPRTNSDFAALRRANKAAADREKEANEAKRALAFFKAGIDPEKPGVTSYFAKAYDGDLTPEAIRAQAVADGILQADPAATAQDAANQQALAAQQRISGAAGSAIAAPDATAQQRQAMNDAYKAGGMDGLAAAMAAMGIPQATN